MNVGSALGADDRRYFFIHVMKTAGGTIREHMRSNFPDDIRYPDWRSDPDGSYWRIEWLRALPPERQRSIKAYLGHFPFVVTDLLGGDFVTLTVLRDPVERVISHLKMRKLEQEPELTLSEIYEGLRTNHDGINFEKFIHNHVTKIFAMTEDDPLRGYMDPILIDEARLEIAKTNLARVDVVAFQDRLDDFYRTMSEVYGWSFGTVLDQHVSPPSDVPNELRERVIEDNRIDIALYEHARERADRA